MTAVRAAMKLVCFASLSIGLRAGAAGQIGLAAPVFFARENLTYISVVEMYVKSSKSQLARF